jgi:hypothetical protein
MARYVAVPIFINPWWKRSKLSSFLSESIGGFLVHSANIQGNLKIKF